LPETPENALNAARRQKPEFWSAQARLRFGTTRPVASGGKRRPVAAVQTLAIQIGLKWVRFHFLKKSKLKKSSMFNGGFAFFELGSFSRFCVF
jgi:hypothetical protein